MDETTASVLRWVAGGGAAAAIAHSLRVWVQGAKAASEVKRHQVFDSGLEYNTRELRKQLEDAKRENESLKGDLALKQLEIVDLWQEKYRLGSQLAAAQAESRLLYERHAKAAIKVVASKRPLSGPELIDELIDTGFGDLVDMPAPTQAPP